MAQENEEAEGGRLAVLSLTALGVVFGDIGTSPLYAIRECFFGEYAIGLGRESVLGVLSLVFWALIVVVSIKYLTFILRADNNGEGGVLALMALASPSSQPRSRAKLVLVILGLFGASLLYGDGMITPAISVLSAAEGLEVATTVFQPWVLPITIVILIGLFLFQRRGTARIGAVFGPVMIVWFVTIAILGARSIVTTPEVLSALNPWYAAHFLFGTGPTGFLVLGAVFLVVTGAEALYADIGHFGTRPIRIGWFGFVLPALVLNYFGQGALLLRSPHAAHNPFYNLAPSWALYPLVALSACATVIASQAVISGAFSLTRQAIQLGYCPRLRVEHTSSLEIGQIYVPWVNTVLLIATVCLVLFFRSSSALAAAYGVAVTTTMILTTTIFYYVARERWHWSRLTAGLPCLAFLAVDLAFFGANVIKIAHGAWFPLAVGLVVFTLLITWKRGRGILSRIYAAKMKPIETFFEEIDENPPARVPGRAAYLTSNRDGVPPVLVHNLRHNRVLHEQVVLLTVVNEEVPRVPSGRHVEVEDLHRGLFRVVAHYGFMESPSVPHILGAAKLKGLDLTMEDTSFFLGRENVIVRGTEHLPGWQAHLFRFMARNAAGVSGWFRIPPDRVIEVGAQVEI